MRLKGLDISDGDSLEKSLLIDRHQEKQVYRYLEVIAIIQAIQEATNSIVSGETKFTVTTENIKKLRDAVFPERAEEVEQKAKRTATLLASELDRGPMAIQALDYGTTKKRKRR